MDQRRPSAFARHDELRYRGAVARPGPAHAVPSALHSQASTQDRDQVEAAPSRARSIATAGPVGSHRPKPTGTPPTSGRTWPLSPRSTATDGPCQRAPAHMSPCRGPPTSWAARGLAHDRLGSVSSFWRAALRKRAHAPGAPNYLKQHQGSPSGRPPPPKAALGEKKAVDSAAAMSRMSLPSTGNLEGRQAKELAAAL